MFFHDLLLIWVCRPKFSSLNYFPTVLIKDKLCQFGIIRTAILKLGKPNNRAENYKLIALQCNGYKLFERIIYNTSNQI